MGAAPCAQGLGVCRVTAHALPAPPPPAPQASPPLRLGPQVAPQAWEVFPTPCPLQPHFLGRLLSGGVSTRRAQADDVAGVGPGARGHGREGGGLREKPVQGSRSGEAHALQRLRPRLGGAPATVTDRDSGPRRPASEKPRRGGEGELTAGPGAARRQDRGPGAHGELSPASGCPALLTSQHVQREPLRPSKRPSSGIKPPPASSGCTSERFRFRLVSTF